MAWQGTQEVIIRNALKRKLVLNGILDIFRMLLLFRAIEKRSPFQYAMAGVLMYV